MDLITRDVPLIGLPTYSPDLGYCVSLTTHWNPTNWIFSILTLVRNT